MVESNLPIKSGSRNKSVIVEVFVQHKGLFIELSPFSHAKIPCNYLNSHKMEKLIFRIDYNAGSPRVTIENVVEEHIKSLKSKYDIIHYQIIQSVDLWIQK